MTGPDLGLAGSDPELAGIFDAFAHGETVADSGLDRRTRLLVQLASAVAGRAPTAYRALAVDALSTDPDQPDQPGLSPVELREVAYQAVPYVGMATALDFVRLTGEVLTERGVDLPLPAQSSVTPQTRFEVGLAVQKQVVGDEQVDAMHDGAPADEKHLQRYLSAHCFGDHVGRGGLALRDRELLTFAMLVALGGADNQVKGHVSGNLRVGNDRAVLLGVLTVLVPWIGYPRTLNGLAALDAVTLG